jgi:hypothetical protein
MPKKGLDRPALDEDLVGAVVDRDVAQTPKEREWAELVGARVDDPYKFVFADHFVVRTEKVERRTENGFVRGGQIGKLLANGIGVGRPRGRRGQRTRRSGGNSAAEIIDPEAAALLRPDWLPINVHSDEMTMSPTTF